MALRYFQKRNKTILQRFLKLKRQTDLLKFVPASGAATRMFKFLHQFLESYDFENEDIDAFLQKERIEIENLFESIENFAFSSLVKDKLEAKFPDFKNFEKGKRYYFFVKMLRNGLNSATRPKVSFLFTNTVKIMLPLLASNCTSSILCKLERHSQFTFYGFRGTRGKVQKTIRRNTEIVENKTGVKFNISYSYQKETIQLPQLLKTKLFR